MAQLTIYMPRELERQLRENAKRAGKSVSSYLTEIVSRALRPRAWPDGFDGLFGSWEGSFPEVRDPPPEEIEPL